MSTLITMFMSLLVYASLALSLYASVPRESDDLNSEREARGLSQALPAAASFTSTLTHAENQIDTIEPSLSMKPTTPLVLKIHSTSILPPEIKVYILSYLSSQNDLLRIRAVSKEWKEATQEVWQSRMLYLLNKPLSDDHFTILAKGTFPCLCLSGVGLNEQNMQILSTCSQFQALSLNGNKLSVTPSLITLLSQARLTHLDLSNNQIGDEGIKALAPSLKNLTALKELYLSNNAITDEGIEILAPILRNLKSLTALDFVRDKIGANGAIALASALQNLQHLTSLNLLSNKINAEGAKAIAELIKEHSALNLVNLHGNFIGNEGAKAIAAALHTNKVLTLISLGSNNIDDEGAKDIATALSVNKTLTSIILCYNKIGIAGVRAIAAALSNNKTLTLVDLASCRIDDEGKKAFRELMRKRPSLKIRYGLD